MLRLRSSWLLPLLTSVLAGPPAAGRERPETGPYLMDDPAAEVALARSAARKNVSEGAAVLVLGREGFVEAAAGTNGFTCLVLRSFSGAPGEEVLWDPRVRVPQCFNPPAARTVLPVILRRTEWALAGAETRDVDARTRRAYAAGELPPPATKSMAYRLSPQQHLPGEHEPRGMPQIVNYELVTADPEAPLRLQPVTVHQWSDDTPAVPAHHRH